MRMRAVVWFCLSTSNMLIYTKVECVWARETAWQKKLQMFRSVLELVTSLTACAEKEDVDDNYIQHSR